MRLALRIVRRILRGLVYLLLGLVILVFVALGAIETGWAKEAIRGVIVRQANQYLTATLEIGALKGSFLRGVELEHVQLSRNGERMISIDRVALSYSLRELFDQGTSIDRIQISGLYVLVDKEPDGRWNLGTLLKRDRTEENRRGPGRPLHLRSVELSKTTVDLREDVTLGPAHLPTRFNDFNAEFAFDYVPVTWALKFSRAAFNGKAPDLTISQLTGSIGNGPDGWDLSNLHVDAPASQLVVDGKIDRRPSPSVLSLKVKADTFSLPEWAPVVPVLSRMAITSAFEARLSGPVDRLPIDLTLRSNGGDVKGQVVIDTSTPRRGFEGSLDLGRLDLAPWLDRPDRPSDISGHVNFKIGFTPGDRFPQGTYAFKGSHASYGGYQGDDIDVRGQLTNDEVRIAAGTATAYGANVRLDGGSIGVQSPFPFTFSGLADGVDLRQLPKTVPVPHVESTLGFEYEVAGRFSEPFIRGNARFHESEFLGTVIGDGGVGSIDTSASPIHYTGEADLRAIDLHRLGRGLDVAWMQDPRYAGILSGHFTVDGRGASTADLTLTGGGRLARADLFGGHLSDADLRLEIASGTLTASYNGALETINPALALNDPRYDASLTGQGRGRIVVQDLLRRSPTIDDYTIDAEGTLGGRVREMTIDSGTFRTALQNGQLTLNQFRAAGPSADVEASGTVTFTDAGSSRLTYAIHRARLEDFSDLLGRDVNGTLAADGQLTGPYDRLHAIGSGTIAGLAVSGVKALAVDAKYDAVFSPDEPAKASVSLDGQASLAQAFGQEIQQISGTASYEAGTVKADLRITQSSAVSTLAGRAVIDPAAKVARLEQLVVSRGRAPWQLEPDAAPSIAWSDTGITVTGLRLADAETSSQHASLDGSWFPQGGGTLRLAARHVAVENFALGAETPPRYSGFLDLDGTLTGSRTAPHLAGRLTVANGKVWQTPYERLAGTFDYAGEDIRVDFRLDQGPGTWLTAVGTVPLAAVVSGQPARPIDLTVSSSSIALGLIEGATDVIKNVGGNMDVNVRVVGTTADPHFDGTVRITDAGFVVSSSGARYKNGRVALTLGVDRIVVNTLHLEDASSRPLDVTGSLATHELRVGDLEIDATARGFEVLRNEFGRVEVDADVKLRGQFETPLVTGRVTIAGGQLNVETILDRTMLQPYAVKPTPVSTTDPIAALNPWDRLALDLELHVPGTLRLVGDNVQVTPGTPLGLGDIRLRAIGDLFFYKGAGTPVYIAGSLDSISGTYSFQSRNFDLDPASSINFRGDLNPELYVMVMREISGVDTRVTIAGPLSNPELRLSSNPPLEQSDILSLIVFNTSTNQLTAAEQQQLVVRAGTLAAGFIAAPMMTALERTLGLESLEIEPNANDSGGTKVSISQEIAPNLLGRFSRQFGDDDYDEVQLEYRLSRILRIRATYSDANALSPRSRFRRIERAGVDLLFFFSF